MQNNVYEANIDALIKAAEILEERQTISEDVVKEPDSKNGSITTVTKSNIIEESHCIESSKTEIHKSIFNRDARKTHNQLEKSRRANIKGRFNRLKELVPNTRGKKCSSLSILRGAVRTVQMLSQRQSELELLEKQLLLEGEGLIKKRELKRQQLVALAIDPDEVITSAADIHSKSNKSCEDSNHSTDSTVHSELHRATDTVRGVKRISASNLPHENLHPQKHNLYEENESTTTASECGDDCDLDELTDDASECGDMPPKFNYEESDDAIDKLPKLLPLGHEDVVGQSLGSSGHSFSSVSDNTNSLNNSTCSSSSQLFDCSQRVLPVKKRRLDWAIFTQSQTDVTDDAISASTMKSRPAATTNLIVPPSLVKELPASVNHINPLSSTISTNNCSRLIVPSDNSVQKSIHPTQHPSRNRASSDLLYQTLTSDYIKRSSPQSATDKTPVTWPLGPNFSTAPANRMPVLQRTLTNELGKSLNLPSRSQIITSPPPRRAGTPGPLLDRSTSLDAPPEGLSPLWIRQKMQPVYNLLGGKSANVLNDLSGLSSSSMSTTPYASLNDASMSSTMKSSPKSSLITSSEISWSSGKPISSILHNENSSLITNLSSNQIKNFDVPRMSLLLNHSGPFSLPVASSFDRRVSSNHHYRKPIPFPLHHRVIDHNNLSDNSNNRGTSSSTIDSSVVLVPVQLATTLTQNSALTNHCLDTLINAVQTQQN